MHGFTDNYIRVSLTPDSSLGTEEMSNTIIPVRLGEWNEAGDALRGSLLPAPPQENA